MRQREGGRENRGDDRNRSRHEAISEDELLRGDLMPDNLNRFPPFRSVAPEGNKGRESFIFEGYRSGAEARNCHERFESFPGENEEVCSL